MAKKLGITDADLCVGCQSCMFACSRRMGVGGLGRSAVLIRSAGGMERGFVVIVCRACLDPPCAKVCPEDALRIRKGGGVLLDTSKCLGWGCRLCQQACPFNCVFWDDTIDKPSICVHCGYCVGYCPYDVIGIQNIEV